MTPNPSFFSLCRWRERAGVRVGVTSPPPPTFTYKAPPRP